MKINNSAMGGIIGFLMAFLILHPLSMVFQEFVHPFDNPMDKVDLLNIFKAFNVHHIPMAFFFGGLGALFGLIIAFYAVAAFKEKERVSMLESLLPICAYCKKIRDDSASEKHKGRWHEVEDYISMKTDTTFTHGMCPECYDNEMEKLDREDSVDADKVSAL